MSSVVRNGCFNFSFCRIFVHRYPFATHCCCCNQMFPAFFRTRKGKEEHGELDQQRYVSSDVCRDLSACCGIRSTRVGKSQRQQAIIWSRRQAFHLFREATMCAKVTWSKNHTKGTLSNRERSRRHDPEGCEEQLIADRSGMGKC